MEISNIIKSLLIRYPLFGNIIANLDFKYTCASVPAPAFTDGYCVYYKQEFIDEFSDDEKEFVIAHEIFHIVLNHLFRNIGKDRDLLNYVEDAIINQLLIRDGMTMPEGLVYVEDALDYSVDELYMKYLPMLDEIKEWMQVNTYHVEIKLEDILNQMYNKDLQELMDDNNEIRNGILDDYQEELKKNAQYTKTALGMEFPSVNVGKSDPLLCWRELLKASLSTPGETITSFYELEMDGILRKEVKPDYLDSESEIIIDSSGSMDMQKIKVILRECKNILSVGQIKVGFCDVEFYGFHEIRNDMDIDNLHIVGRGGTSFENMAKNFSDNVDNKIVITDGLCDFPKGRPDILWIVIGYNLPIYLNSKINPSIKDINYIFINERDIPVTNKERSLILKK